MRPVLLLLASLMFVPGSGRADQADRPEELIVFGKLEDQRYLGSLDELGMNGIIEAQLRVSGVVKGRPPSRRFRVQYIAHGFLSGDRALRFRLRRDSDGTYFVCGEGGPGFICK